MLAQNMAYQTKRNARLRKEALRDTRCAHCGKGPLLTRHHRFCSVSCREADRKQRSWYKATERRKSRRRRAVRRHQG